MERKGDKKEEKKRGFNLVKEDEKGKTKEKDEKTRKIFDRRKLLAIFLVAGIAILVFIIKSALTFNLPPTSPHDPSPANGAAVKRGKVTLTWKCEDPDKNKLSFDLYISSKGQPKPVAQNLKEASYTINVLPEKEYSWKVVARDEKGATTEGPIWKFSVVRNNPPSIPRATTPPPGQTLYSTEVTFSWQAKDPDGDKVVYYLYIDGKLATKSTLSSYNTHLDYGRHTWKVMAEDELGAKSEAGPWEIFIEKQNHPPEISLNIPKPPLKPGVYEISWIASDEDNDPLVFEIYLDSKLLCKTNKNTCRIELKSGKHTFKVIANDGKDAAYAERVLLVKTEREKAAKKVTNLPPSLPFGPKPFNGEKVRAGKITLSWGCVDLDGKFLLYDVYLDGKKIAENLQTPKLDIEVSPGEHTWKVVVRDDTANVVEGRVWKFEALKEFPEKQISPLPVAVSLGTKGIYVIDINSGDVISKFSGYPIYTIENFGEDLIGANEKELLVFSTKNSLLSLQEIINIPFQPKEIAVDGKKIYVVGEDGVYINGRTIELKDASAITLKDGYIYIGAGTKILRTKDGQNFEQVADVNLPIKKLRSGSNIMVVFEGGIGILENGHMKKLFLPNPQDILETSEGYIVADARVGIVYLNPQLIVKAIVDVPSPHSLKMIKGHIIVGGKGLWLIDGLEKKRIYGGIGEVLYACGNVRASNEGIYKNGSLIISGKPQALACSENNWAAVVEGNVYVNGKLTDVKGSDVAIDKDRIYVASDEGLIVLDKNGKVSAKLGISYNVVSRGGYAASNVIWKPGLEETKLKGMTKDIASDIVVAVLEEGRVEIFGWNLKKISELKTNGNAVETKGYYVFVGTEKGIKVFSFKGGMPIKTIPTIFPVKDLNIDENLMYAALGDGRVNIYDLRSLPYLMLLSTEENIDVLDLALLKH